MDTKQLEALRQKAVDFDRWELHRDEARRFNDELLADPALFEAAVGVHPPLKVNVFTKAGVLHPSVSVFRAVELYWRDHASEGCQTRITQLLDKNVEWAEASEEWCRKVQPLKHAEVVMNGNFYHAQWTDPAVRQVYAAAWKTLAAICTEQGQAGLAAHLSAKSEQFAAA